MNYHSLLEAPTDITKPNQPTNQPTNQPMSNLAELYEFDGDGQGSAHLTAS